MSQGNVDINELADRAVDALNRDDLDGFLDLVDPEVEFTSMIAEAEGETFRGHDGVRRWWESIRNAFEEVRWTHFGIQTHGERGVARQLLLSTFAAGNVLLRPL